MSELPPHDRPDGKAASDTEGAAKPEARTGGGAYEGGLQAGLAVVISMGFGIWADSYFGSSPIGLFIGLAVGFGAFTLRIWRLLQRQSSAGQDSGQGPKSGRDD